MKDREQADISELVENRELFVPFGGSTVFVTGATGLIGSMLLKTLLAANRAYGLGMELVGQIRNPDKARALFGPAFGNFRFVETLDVPCRWIVHALSPTASRFFVEHPVETIQASVGSAMEILETARKHKATLLYLSSMEQYGVPYASSSRMTESDIGVIDHLNVRSSYSESKRLCECLCASYASEYGVHATIARLAQTFGAGVPPSDNRMPMQFARAALEGRDIVLHTEGRSVSNFVYLSDAISAILLLLAKGAPGQAYNVCHDSETRRVRDIAALVAQEVTQGKIGVRIEKAEHAGYAPDTELRLDSSKLAALGWTPRIGMREAYGRLLAYLEECR